jgi:hypothetical protein
MRPDKRTCRHTAGHSKISSDSSAAGSSSWSDPRLPAATAGSALDGAASPVAVVARSGRRPSCRCCCSRRQHAHGSLDALNVDDFKSPPFLAEEALHRRGAGPARLATTCWLLSATLALHGRCLRIGNIVQNAIGCAACCWDPVLVCWSPPSECRAARAAAARAAFVVSMRWRTGGGGAASPCIGKAETTLQ